jgi:hypothetical protein
MIQTDSECNEHVILILYYIICIGVYNILMIRMTVLIYIILQGYYNNQLEGDDLQDWQVLWI